MKLVELPVNQIRIGPRVRQDDGDLAELCTSIKRRGLLQPIVVTGDLQLVCGARRLAAFRSLERTSIPALITDSVADARAANEAERDENVCRKDFTLSEKIRFTRIFEDLERKEARRRERSGKAQPPENFSGGSPGRVRDVLGAMVGLSGITYERAKKVVVAAKQNPARFGDLVEKMDATGKVTPAYNELRARQQRSWGRRPKTPLLKLIDELIEEANRPVEQVQMYKLRTKLKELRERVSSTQLGRKLRD